MVYVPDNCDNPGKRKTREKKSVKKDLLWFMTDYLGRCLVITG